MATRQSRIAEKFYDYLKRGNGLGTFTRDELREVLKHFKEENGITNFCPSNLIYLLQLDPPLLRCVGQNVYFKGTPEFTATDHQEKEKEKAHSSHDHQSYKKQRENPDQNTKIILTSQLRNKNQRAKFITNNYVAIECVQSEFLTEELGFYECFYKDSDSAKITLQIQNMTDYDVIFARVWLLNEVSDIEFSNSIDAIKSRCIVRLPAGCNFEVTLNCTAAEFGTKACNVIFEFLVLADETLQVVMARFLCFNKTNDCIDSLKATSRYKKQEFLTTQMLNYERSNYRPTCTGNNLATVLEPEQYKISKEVRSFVENEIKNGNEKSNIRTLLESKLTEENYTNKFSHLIWAEEIQLFKEVNKYGIRNKTLVKAGKRFELKLKDLAERRPSVLRGDRIFVSSLNMFNQLKEFEGFVHEVERDRIMIGFRNGFEKFFTEDSVKKFTFRFTISRFPFRGKQRSIGPLLTNQHPCLLFPKADRSANSFDQELKLYNKELSSNTEQCKAVKSIVFGNSRVPYIIYGPPGTGKTSTLVEAILQMIKYRPNAHMLVCAPSNNASDLIMQRMLSFYEGLDVFRLCAWTRPFRNWDRKKAFFIKKFKEKVNFNQADRDYFYPTIEKLMKHKVLVTTLTFAGRLASAGFPNNHFDFVFADEAANAQEPEVMTAVAGVLSPKGRLILAGDPKQLGPVITSHIAMKYGLGKSYMERIMETQEVYQPEEAENTDNSGPRMLYDENYITKLLNNYRSHEEILKIPNQRFYDNELRACLSEDVKKKLPKQGFPIIFHAVRGKNDREGNSPSYFNAYEIEKAIGYVDELLAEKGNGITLQHIGIITPYNKQVKKFQKVLRGENNGGNKNGGMTDTEKKFSKIKIDMSKFNGVDKLKVGTVEAFQGDERRVIIISTVRSDCQNLDHDKKFNLGFLVDPKRFNVAVTRAALLLIVVGNPDVLCTNDHWRALIEHCIEKGGYRGKPPNPVSEESMAGNSKDSKEEEIMQESTKFSKR